MPSLVQFSVQFLQGEFPCPLCMLQRYAMILVVIPVMWLVMEALRGTLTRGRYARSLGMSLLAAVGAVVTVYCTSMIYASLKPIRELLRSRVQAVDAHDESDRQWTHDLTAAIGDAGLTMQVVLAEIETTLGRFNAMKPGDVLYFKKPELARAIINEIPIFEVEVGSAGPMVAVKAQKAVELKHD